MEGLSIIVGLILGGLVILSAFKGMLSILLGRGSAPKHFSDYANAGIRGRDPFKESKPLFPEIFKLIVVILAFPGKLFKKILPKKFTWLSGPIGFIIWVIVALLILA